MKKRYLASCLLIAALTLGAFQNCSSSLPANATSSSSNLAVSTALASCTVDGNTVGSGAQVTGYVQSVANGAACPAAEALTCTNGMWYGATPLTSTGISTGSDGEGSQVAFPAAFSTCTSENQSCTAAGGTLASGATMPAFSASTVAYGSLCSAIAATLSCTNGVVTSSTGAPSTYTSATCAPATFSGTYVYTSEIFTYAYQTPMTADAIPACTSNVGGGACSSKGAKCYVDYGNYQNGYNYFHGYTCQ